MIMIKDFKKQQLEESYIQGGNAAISYKEWVEQEAENDLHFYSWIFDDDSIDDFGTGMSDEQKNEFNEFISNL